MPLLPSTVQSIVVQSFFDLGAVAAGETLPEADTLDCTVLRETVTVRATPLAEEEDVP